MGFFKSKRFYILILILIVFFFSVFLFDLNSSIEFLKQNILYVTNFAQNNPVLFFFLFLLSSILFYNSPIPLVMPYTLLSGYLYGFIYGGLFNVLSLVVASLFGYYFYRHLLSHHEIQTYKKRYFILSHTTNNSFFYFTNLRLVNFVPYFLISMMAGLLKIDIRIFLGSSILGGLLNSFFYSYVGSVLYNITSVVDIFTLEVIILFIAYILLFNVSFFVKKLFIKSS